MENLARLCNRLVDHCRAIALCEFHTYLWFPVAFALIGNRQHALLLIMHEGAHGKLHPNRMLNSVLTEFVTWPIFHSGHIYKKYRHLPHHRNIGHIDDPHIAQSYSSHPHLWKFPKTRSEFGKHLFLASLLSSKEFVLFSPQLPGLLWKESKVAGFLYVAFHTLLAGFFISMGWLAFTKYIALWVLPIVIWAYTTAGYLRLISEHFAIPTRRMHGQAVGGGTRSIHLNFFLAELLFPHAAGYHIEHHWYPSVPWYNHRKLHLALMNLPKAREHMHITRGLRNLLAEFTSQGTERLDGETSESVELKSA